MSGPYCKTCAHYRPMPIGEPHGECNDPAKIIYYGKGGNVNSAPEVSPDMTCRNYTGTKVTGSYTLDPELEAENERLRKAYIDLQHQADKERIAMSNKHSEHAAKLTNMGIKWKKDAERWRESQELGMVPWDTIIEAIGDWGGEDHECFNRAIRYIKAEMEKK